MSYGPPPTNPGTPCDNPELVSNCLVSPLPLHTSPEECLDLTKDTSPGPYTESEDSIKSPLSKVLVYHICLQNIVPDMKPYSASFSVRQILIKPTHGCGLGNSSMKILQSVSGASGRDASTEQPLSEGARDRPNRTWVLCSLPSSPA